MIKRIITSVIVTVALAIGSNIMYAEQMDRQWCLNLIELKDSVCVPDSVAEPMVMQCAIFQQEAVQAIKRICKIDGAEDRKIAADEFNHQHKDDYNIYIQMVRALREYMDRNCLGAAAAIMAYDIMKTNSEINTMFTIFRSSRPLPENKYTEEM